MKKIFMCMSLCCVVGGTVYADISEKLTQYVYEDTRQLVMFVEDAASLVEKKGDAAFDDFSVKNSKWLNEKYYIFVYDSSGTCVFHPIEPSLVGQDLQTFKDLNGKPVIALITDVAKKPQPNANGWVFYLWEESMQSPIPSWKSSYVRKVIAPDGKVYVVGSGVYNMKIEKIFIQENVDSAAVLIVTKGKDTAFSDLKSASCPFNIFDNYIVVIDTHGSMVVDPAFPELDKKRNVLHLYDKTGSPYIKQAIEGLTTTDSIWKIFMWPKPGTYILERRLLYVRKIKVNGELLYVCSDFAPAMPIWMKQ